MDGESVAELVIAYVGFLLITVTGASGYALLSWLGIWLVMGALFWHWHRVRRKARKEGKEVFLN